MDHSPICRQVSLGREKLLNPPDGNVFRADVPVLLVPAAGRGIDATSVPKCIEPVLGVPLARHSIDAFRQMVPQAPVVCIVGNQYESVVSALGPDNCYVRTANPSGGTGWAVYEAFCLPGLLEANPNVVISMGDRVVPRTIFERLLALHTTGGEADFSMMTAWYDPPLNRGKGRIVRNPDGRVIRILEESDIVRESDPLVRNSLLSLTEGNCPLYIVRAKTLVKYLMFLSNDNAREQYYLTDIVTEISKDGGSIRSFLVRDSLPEYSVLCSDISSSEDIAALEHALRVQQRESEEIATAARQIRHRRPAGQLASIRRQLRELYRAASGRKLDFHPDKPVALGICGGRLRIAFMHPDMGRFFGPALQAPFGAKDENGTEQIVLFIQEADDRRVHLFPLNPLYRESVDSIRADVEEMYPGEDISDWYSYEEFGTRMSRHVLLSLGYFSEEELENRRRNGMPLPPQSLWVENNMRRPFSLVGNAIASLRTYHEGRIGEAIAASLGRARFRGLRLASTGMLPQGGFSSSSALTVATKNALNALFELGLSPDQLIHLACQAEYGTGVRAGSLDQATEQKGESGIGTLLSSNPAEHYRVLGKYPAPPDFIHVLFPYSVARDVESHLWSAGFYRSGTSSATTGILTTNQIRKMTGKAAEIAALLLKMPLDRQFFQEIQDELLDSGRLGPDARRHVAKTLRALPQFVERDELVDRVRQTLPFYESELARCRGVSAETARSKARTMFSSLFDGWCNPLLPLARKERDDRGYPFVDGPKPWSWVRGVPLRAMVAYLYAEVARNFFMLNNPDRWIEFVDRSQWGDTCFTLDANRIPNREILERIGDWERDMTGPERLTAWLARCGATPFDFTEDLDDATLDADPPPEFHLVRGTNFFRGLALVDFARAALRRVFGDNAVAVRMNAAGQGDYFQVHVDTRKTDPEDVERFIRKAFYERFGLTPVEEFIDVHPGAGAVGVRLNRFALVPQLIEQLREEEHS